MNSPEVEAMGSDERVDIIFSSGGKSRPFGTELAIEAAAPNEAKWPKAAREPAAKEEFRGIPKEVESNNCEGNGRPR